MTIILRRSAGWIKRGTAVALSLSLLWQETASAALFPAAQDPSILSQFEHNLRIPAKIATITDASAGKVASRLPEFILIQDLHANPFVQKNIAGIIERGFKRWGLHQVFVEGGFGRIDVSLIRTLPRKQRTDLTEELLTQGYLSGPELAAVQLRDSRFTSSNLSPIKMIGLESPDLYWQQLVAYRKTRSLEYGALQELQTIGSLQADMGLPADHPLAKQYQRTKKLVRLELTPEDYQAYLNDRTQSPHMKYLASAVTAAEEFYRLAKHRDEVMLKNAMESNNSAEPTVMVIGGFHSKGISEKLRQAGKSFVILTPIVAQLGYEHLYRDRMQESLGTAQIIRPWIESGSAIGRGFRAKVRRERVKPYHLAADNARASHMALPRWMFNKRVWQFATFGITAVVIIALPFLVPAAVRPQTILASFVSPALFGVVLANARRTSSVTLNMARSSGQGTAGIAPPSPPGDSGVPISIKEFLVDLHKQLIQMFPEQGFSLREQIRMTHFVRDEWTGLGLQAIAKGLELIYGHQLSYEEQTLFATWVQRFSHDHPKPTHLVQRLPQSLEEAAFSILPDDLRDALEGQPLTQFPEITRALIGALVAFPETRDLVRSAAREHSDPATKSLIERAMQESRAESRPPSAPIVQPTPPQIDPARAVAIFDSLMDKKSGLNRRTRAAARLDAAREAIKILAVLNEDQRRQLLQRFLGKAGLIEELYSSEMVDTACDVATGLIPWLSTEQRRQALEWAFDPATKGKYAGYFDEKLRKTALTLAKSLAPYLSGEEKDWVVQQITKPKEDKSDKNMFLGMASFIEGLIGGLSPDQEEQLITWLLSEGIGLSDKANNISRGATKIATTLIPHLSAPATRRQFFDWSLASGRGLDSPVESERQDALKIIQSLQPFLTEVEKRELIPALLVPGRGINDEGVSARVIAAELIAELMPITSENQQAAIATWLTDSPYGIHDRYGNVYGSVSNIIQAIAPLLTVHQRTPLLDWFLNDRAVQRRLTEPNNVSYYEETWRGLGGLYSGSSPGERKRILDWALDSSTSWTGAPVAFVTQTRGEFFKALANLLTPEEQEYILQELLSSKWTQGDLSLRWISAHEIHTLTPHLSADLKEKVRSWLVAKNMGLRDPNPDVKNIAATIVVGLLNRELLRERSRELSSLLSTPIDEETDSDTALSANFTGHGVASGNVSILDAAFHRPSSWGAPSADAPDVELVDSHARMKEILTERASAGRAPPAFAVATVPFLKLLESLLFSVKHNYAMLLEGQTALGKSFAVRTLASLLKVPLRSLNIHPALSDEDLLGSLQPNANRGKESHPDANQILVFKDGHLVEAMERGEWVVLEELNMGSTGALETLNFYLSHGEIFVRRNGHTEKVTIHPRFRLFATQNPKHYGARQKLSRPFLSRWVRWILGFKDKSEEQEHLVPTLMVLNGFTNSTARQLVEIHQAVSDAAVSWVQGTAMNEPYEFDQRHLLRMSKRLPELEGKAFVDLTQDQKEAIAVAFWNTYGLGLREVQHRKNFFELLDHHLGLKATGLEDYKALEAKTLVQMRQGKEDTNEALAEVAAIPATSQPEQIPGDRYALKATPTQRKAWWALIDSFKSGEHVLLSGIHAAGKTSLVFGLFHLLRQPLYYFNLHDNRSIEDLVGTISQKKDGTFDFVPGPLVDAMKAGAALFVDELNLSELPEWLNTVMDTGELALPDGTILKAKAGFRIIAAMNPATEEGRRPLSPALRSRWREVWVDEVTSAKELEQIVQDKLGKAGQVQVTRPKDITQPEGETETLTLRKFLVQLHRQLKAQFPEQGFSLRELLRLTTFVAGEAITLGPLAIVKGLEEIYGHQLLPAEQNGFSDWLSKTFGEIIAPKRIDVAQIDSIEKLLSELLPSSVPPGWKEKVMDWDYQVLPELAGYLAMAPTLFPILLQLLTDHKADPVSKKIWVFLAQRPDILSKLTESQLHDLLNSVFDQPNVFRNEGLSWQGPSDLVAAMYPHLAAVDKQRVLDWLFGSGTGLEGSGSHEDRGECFAAIKVLGSIHSLIDPSSGIQEKAFQMLMGSESVLRRSNDDRSAAYKRGLSWLASQMMPNWNKSQRDIAFSWIMNDSGLFGDRPSSAVKSVAAITEAIRWGDTRTNASKILSRLYPYLEPVQSSQVMEAIFGNKGVYRENLNDRDAIFDVIDKIYPHLSSDDKEKVRTWMFDKEPWRQETWIGGMGIVIGLIGTVLPDLHGSQRETALAYLFSHPRTGAESAVQYLPDALVKNFSSLPTDRQHKLLDWLFGPQRGVNGSPDSSYRAGIRDLIIGIYDQLPRDGLYGKERVLNWLFGPTGIRNQDLQRSGEAIDVLKEIYRTIPQDRTDGLNGLLMGWIFDPQVGLSTGYLPSREEAARIFLGLHEKEIQENIEKVSLRLSHELDQHSLPGDQPQPVRRGSHWRIGGKADAPSVPGAPTIQTGGTAKLPETFEEFLAQIMPPGYAADFGGTGDSLSLADGLNRIVGSFNGFAEFEVFLPLFLQHPSDVVQSAGWIWIDENAALFKDKPIPDWLIGELFDQGKGLLDEWAPTRIAASQALVALFPYLQIADQKRGVSYLLGIGENTGLRDDTDDSIQKYAVGYLETIVPHLTPALKQKVLRELRLLVTSKTGVDETQKEFAREALWKLGDATEIERKDQDINILLGMQAAVGIKSPSVETRGENINLLDRYWDLMTPEQQQYVISYLVGQDGNTGIRDQYPVIQARAIVILSAIREHLSTPVKSTIFRWILDSKSGTGLASPNKEVQRATIRSLAIMSGSLAARYKKDMFKWASSNLRSKQYRSLESELVTLISALWKDAVPEDRQGLQAWLDEFMAQDPGWQLKVSFEEYLIIRQDVVEKNVERLKTSLMKPIDAEKVEESGSESKEMIKGNIVLGLAAFQRPSSWGAPSEDAPDVELVDSHAKVKEILTERASAGRAPPAFAVATAPFMKLLESLLFSVKHNYAMLLEGQTALGKSFAVRTLASILKVPLRSLNIHPALSDEDLLGSLQPNPNRGKEGHPDANQILVFKDGHLVEAMERGEWVVLEELNMGSTGALETLNFYLSHGEIFVRRNGHTEKVTIHPRFRLFATQNPKHYGARQKLSRPFLSRWVRWIMGFKDKAEEQEHLIPTLMVLNGFANSTARQLVEIHQSISDAAASWVQGTAMNEPYEFDQRHLLRMARRLPELEGKAFGDLTNDQKEAIAIAFWNTYGLGLREVQHRKNFFELLDHHLGLKAVGLDDYKALEAKTLVQMRQGKEDTNEALAEMAAMPEVPESQTGHIPGDRYALKATPTQRKAWWALVDSFKSGEHVLLSGIHAAGKTSLVFGLFHLLGQPLYYFNLHDNRSIEDLVGTISQKRDGTFDFVPGPLVDAMKAGAALFVDELNLSELPEWLNTVMDTGELALPDGTILKAKAGFRIIAAMNPATEEGRRPLSPALRSRWREVWVDEVTSTRELEQIVKDKLGTADQINVTRPKNMSQPDGETETLTLRKFLVQLHRKLKEQFPEQGYSLRELLRFTIFVAGESLQIGPMAIVKGLWEVYGHQLPLDEQETFSDWLIEHLGSQLMPSEQKIPLPSSYEEILLTLFPTDIATLVKEDVLSGEYSLMNELRPLLRDPVINELWSERYRQHSLKQTEMSNISDYLFWFAFDELPLNSMVEENFIMAIVNTRASRGAGLIVLPKVFKRFSKKNQQIIFDWFFQSGVGLSVQSTPTVESILLIYHQSLPNSAERQRIEEWLFGQSSGLKGAYGERVNAIGVLAGIYLDLPENQSANARARVFGREGLLSNDPRIAVSVLSGILTIWDRLPITGSGSKTDVQKWLFASGTGINAPSDSPVRSMAQVFVIQKQKELLFPKSLNVFDPFVARGGIGYAAEPRDESKIGLQIFQDVIPKLSDKQKQKELTHVMKELNTQSPNDNYGTTLAGLYKAFPVNSAESQSILSWIYGPKTGLRSQSIQKRRAAMRFYLIIHEDELRKKSEEFAQHLNQDIDNQSMALNANQPLRYARGLHWRIGQPEDLSKTEPQPAPMSLEKMISNMLPEKAPQEIIDMMQDYRASLPVGLYMVTPPISELISYLAIDPRLHSLLMLLAKDENPDVRVGALRAIAKTGAANAGAMMEIFFGSETGLEDSNPDVRAHAMRSLGMAYDRLPNQEEVRVGLSSWLKRHQAEMDSYEDYMTQDESPDLKAAMILGIRLGLLQRQYPDDGYDDMESIVDEEMAEQPGFNSELVDQYYEIIPDAKKAKARKWALSVISEKLKHPHESDPAILRYAVGTLATILDREELLPKDREVLHKWLLAPDDGITSDDPDTRLKAGRLYLKLFEQSIKANVQKLGDQLSQNLDHAGNVEQDTDKSSGHIQSRQGIQILSAYFARPANWGIPSEDAPDVELVDSHAKVKEVLAARASAGRAPPAFAVATVPFMKLLESLLFSVKHNYAMLLEGQTALGKSFAVRTLASLLKVPLRSLNIHPALSDEDLLGSLQPNPNRGKEGHSDANQILIFKDGHLVEAMERGEWVVLEELNMGSTGALETLNFYLSHGEIYVRRNGHTEKVTIHPRFRLFATQNPKHYGARQKLSRPFLSRWMRWILGFKDKSEEQEHLVPTLMVLNGFTNSTARQLVEIHQSISDAAASWVQGTAMNEPYEFDQRHLLRMAKRLPELEGKALADLTKEEKEAIAIAFWNTYGLGLREVQHRKNFFELLDHHLALKAPGLADYQTLEAKTLIQMRQGKEDTNDGLTEVAAMPVASDLEHIPSDRYALKATPTQRKAWWALIDSFKSNEHVLLSGVHAAGKTSLVFGLFHLLRQPLYYFNLHDNRSIEDLVGTISQKKDGSFDFVPGPLVEAMRSGAALFVDELNLSELPEWLNTVMDTGELALPDGTILKAMPGFRIIAAMNPATEEGRRPLSPALRSRWREVWVDEVSDRGEMIGIVRQLLGEIGDILIPAFPIPDLSNTSTPSGSAPLKMEKDSQGPKEPQRMVPLRAEKEPAAEDQPLRRGYRTEEERVRDFARNRWGTGPEATANTEKLLKSVEELKGYVHDIGVMMGGDKNLTLEEGNYWAHDLQRNVLIYPLQDLLDHSAEYIQGVALHEGSHRDISRYRPDDPQYTEFFETETMRLLLNVIEDPRVNNNVEKRFPKKLEALYDAEWPKDMTKLGQSEVGKGLLSEFGVPDPKTKDRSPSQLLPHMQYAHGIIYLWRHQEIADFVVDPEVRTLLTQHRKTLEALFTLLPEERRQTIGGEEFLVAPGEMEKLKTMDELVSRIHREIVPDYKRLIEKSKQEVEKMLKSGQLKPSSGEGGESMPDELLSDEAKKFMEDQASKVNKRLDPKLNPPQYGDAKKAGEESARRKAEADKGKPEEGKPGKAGEPIRTYGDLLRQKIQTNRIAQAQRGTFERYLHPVMAQAARLRSRMENVLYPNSRMRKVGWFRRGTPDARKLMQGVGRDFRNKSDLYIFTQKILPTLRRYNAAFVIDHSGSMSGPKAGAAKRVLAMLIYAFQGLLPVASYGFSDGVSRYTDYPEELSDKAKDRLMQGVEMAYQSGGGTNLPAAIALSADELAKQSGDRKFLFVITDGESTHGSIKPALDGARKAGIHVIRVFLGPKNAGQNHEFDYDIHVENPDQLPDELANLLEKNMLGDLSDSRSRAVQYVHSSASNTQSYSAMMLAAGAAVTGLKLTLAAVLPAVVLPWIVPLAILGLGLAGVLHWLDIKRTGSPIMATTTERQTVWDTAYHLLSPISKAVIRVEEGWHRLPLGSLSRNEVIAKSLGILLSPLALLLAPVPNPEVQIVHTWKPFRASRRMLSAA